MKIKKVSVEAMFLKSLANYQNVRFTAGCEAELSDTDNAKESYQKLWDMCGEQINEQLKLFEEKKK